MENKNEEGDYFLIYKDDKTGGVYSVLVTPSGKCVWDKWDQELIIEPTSYWLPKEWKKPRTPFVMEEPKSKK